jgi:hypothetical protein
MQHLPAHPHCLSIHAGLQHRSVLFSVVAVGIFTVCVKDMVQPDVDVVLVEFAVNDPKATGRFRDPDRLSFERLLRKLLEFQNR